MLPGLRRPLALRLAGRELRGGLAGFRIFLACLLLGVAAIAGIGSLSRALMTGLEEDARALLGGDLEVRLIHREASAEERAWLEANSAALSQSADLRAMAHRAGREDASPTLVELKGVDAAYPLHGRVASEPPRALDEALEKRGGSWGALVDPALLARLDLSVGERLRIGEVSYEIRGRLQREPDRAARGFALGPRVLVALASLEATGLKRTGSLIYHHYRMDLPAGSDIAAWRARLEQRFPDAGWRVRDVRNAAPGVARFVERLTLFMTLVGLTALLVGGVGVANAVKSYLDGRRATIATLKCLGAPGRLVFQVYLAQVLVLAGLGIAAGVVLGALTPFAAQPVLAARLGVDVAAAVYPRPLAVAGLLGLLTALAFSLWPLARAQEIPAAALFRAVVAPSARRPPLWALAAVAAAGLTLAALAVADAQDRPLALGFVAGAACALAVFRGGAEAVMRLARRLPRPRRPGLRLALANLHRPGAPTGSVVLSLGLGLTVLVTVALIEGNLRRQVSEEMPRRAPAFYFLDIQPSQAGAFERLVRGHPGVEELHSAPMLRGRIVAVDGVRTENMRIPEDVRWVFHGDRGLTWRAEPPAGAQIVEGEWWPADYDGAPLVSLYAEVGRALGLHPGGTLTVNVLGRPVEAEIANLRRVEWTDLGMDFVMIFSPGMLEGAPQSRIATVRVAPAQEEALLDAVAARFPNVTAVRVREVLQRVAEMLGDIAAAVRATAAVTVLAGTLVLAGAVAAGQRRRVYDAVVLKVLGATRRDLVRAYLLEYGATGLLSAAIAAAVGTLAAYLVLTRVMQADFGFLPWSVLATAALATTLTVAFGYLGTWRALRQKAAPLLRNE